jgi:signal transduction histidine kinase
MTEPVTEQPSVSRWQRRLLPGELLEATAARRSPRDWVVDVLLIATALVIGSFNLSETWSDHSDAMIVLDIVAGTAVCLALWVRRTRPVEVAVAAVIVATFSAMAGGAVVVAVFNAAVRASRLVLLAIVAASLCSLAIFVLLYPSVGSFDEQMVVGSLLVGGAAGWGLFARVRRELVYSLHERAKRLESDQKLRVEQAREAERRRIAREMHDVLAHRLSLLSVQAGALEFNADADPREVAEAAGVIRATAQTALEELRDVIGVLRDDGDDQPVEPPQPTLAQLPALIEESRAAGMEIRTSIDEAADAELPPALGRTAYRIVQEGLTNARKHAPGASVDVSITSHNGPALVVAVVSRRAVGVTANRGAPEGTGAGLVGLTERVSLAGGELKYGSNEAGDFVLRALLPWTP